MQSLGVISINLWQVLISLANLGILFLLVKKFLFQPVRKILAQRQAHVDQLYAEADEAKAKAFIAEIRAMNKRMGIPTGFDFIKEDDIPQMIKWALAEANPVYPVPVVYNKKRCEKVIRRIVSEA